MANMRFKILPGLSDLITGKVEVSQIIARESVQATSHEKIKVLAAVDLDAVFCATAVERLLTAARKNDIVGIIEGLKILVPEYTPTYHFTGDAPVSFRRMRPDLHAKA
jgi:hypothetical protein